MVRYAFFLRDFNTVAFVKKKNHTNESISNNNKRIWINQNDKKSYLVNRYEIVILLLNIEEANKCFDEGKKNKKEIKCKW